MDVRALFLCLVLTTALQALSAHAANKKAKPSLSLAFFGDSLSDSGTNAFVRSKGLVPDPAHYSKGRFSNGLVWTQYLKFFTNKKVQSVSNHAYGGAVACAEFYYQGSGLNESFGPLPLWNQTAKYLSERKPLVEGAKNIVVIEIGSNDLYYFLTAGNTTAAVSKVASCIANSIRYLANNGEAVFVVGNLASATLTPSGRGMPEPQRAALGSLIQGINLAIETSLSQLKLPGVKIYQLDFLNVMSSALKAANVTGLETAKSCITTIPADQGPYFAKTLPPMEIDVCPSKGKGYFFYDHVHPTTEGHKLIAAAAARQFRSWGLF